MGRVRNRVGARALAGSAVVLTMALGVGACSSKPFDPSKFPDGAVEPSASTIPNPSDAPEASGAPGASAVPSVPDPDRFPKNAAEAVALAREVAAAPVD